MSAFEMREYERLRAASHFLDGRVYFVRHTQTGLIKIGHAERVIKRMSGLGTMYGGRLAYIGSFPGTYEDKSGLHRKYVQQRINRWEWFIPCAQLIAEIRDSCNDFDPHALTVVKDDYEWRVPKRDLLHALEAVT